MATAAVSLPSISALLCSSGAGLKTRRRGNDNKTIRRRNDDSTSSIKSNNKDDKKRGGVLGNFGEVLGKDIKFIKTRVSRGIEWANGAFRIPEISKTLEDVVWLRNLEDPSVKSFEFPTWPNPQYPGFILSVIVDMC